MAFNRCLDTHSLLPILALNKLPKEIRDECRQDPNVPKYILIEIAWKKQERGMVTQSRNTGISWQRPPYDRPPSINELEAHYDGVKATYR